MPLPIAPEGSFARELEHLINRYSQENASNTPDFILAQFLLACLTAWNESTTLRDQWYDHKEREP